MSIYDRYIGKEIRHHVFGPGKIEGFVKLKNGKTRVLIRFDVYVKGNRNKWFNVDSFDNPRYFNQKDNIIQILKRCKEMNSRSDFLCPECGETGIRSIAIVRRHFNEKHGEQLSEGEVARLLSNGKEPYVRGPWKEIYCGAPGLGKRG